MRDWAAVVRARLAAKGEDPGAHAEAIDELAQHLADTYWTSLRRGEDELHARAAAEAELDGIGPLVTALGLRARRQVAAAPPSGRSWMGGALTDVRQAIRSVRLNPGFATLVTLTLGVCIGACVAIFSVYNGVVLGSLPYPAPQELALLWETDADDPGRQFITSAPAYEDWVAESRSFAALGAWEYLTFNVAGAQEPEQIPGIRASSSLFDVLGVPPALGRVFTPAEDEPGHRVAVVSDAVWRVHLGGDPLALGRTLRLNAEAYEIIGVMPAGFHFPRSGYGVWVPIAFTPQDRDRDSHSFFVAGRLAGGVSFEQARDEMRRIGSALELRHEEHRGESASATRMSEFGTGELRTMLGALLGATGLLLLIACVNVANLMIGRALARRRDFAVRLALGARPGRLATLLCAEGLVLAALAGGVGLLLAWVATRAADLWLAPSFRALPFRGEVPIVIDTAVLMFALSVALGTVVVFGFAPMAEVMRQQPRRVFHGGTRGSTSATGLARRALMALEIALAVMVLTGAGLLVTSLQEVLAEDPGLDPVDVLTMQVSLPQDDTYGPPERAGFCRELATSVEGLPGVVSISAISHLPLSGANASRAIRIEGHTPPPGEGTSANYRLACPDYFRTLGIPLIAGREFTDRDVREGTPVVVINRSTAERYWPGEDPIGRRITVGDTRASTDGEGAERQVAWRAIVGVVEDVRHFGLDAAPTRELFLPYSQAAWPIMTLVARTAGEPLLWERAVRDAVRRVDPDLPVARVRSMEMVIDASVGWRATPMRLLAGFGIVGLLLAGLGIYGVLAYYVSQRTREIGVRTALGATPRQIVGLVIRQSVVPLAAGLAVGTVGAVVAGQLVQGVLYNVSPGDPEVLGGVAVLLAAVTIAASWLPARRAAAIDPVVALRDD